jgi:DNA-binding NarL/FixJ family response regulator
LGLVARGLSNRRIAEALYISERTVERHLANCYQKMDVTNRAEAIARFVETAKISN